MKKQLLFWAINYLSVFYAFSQDSFELLIPWSNEGDTSVFGLTALEDSSGDFLLLSNIQEFDAGLSGIPITGPMTFGTGIIKISPIGGILWHELYATNHYTPQDPLSFGRVPTEHFIINNEYKIILPHSILTEILPCDSLNSNIGRASFKKAIMSIDIDNGEIVTNERFLDDYLCDTDEIAGFKETDWGYILLYYDDFYHTPLYIEKLSHDFEVLGVDTFYNETKWVQFSEYSENILIASQATITLIDSEASILQTFDVHVEDTLWSASIKWAENESYYVFGMTDYSYFNRNSSLYFIDKQGDTVKSAFFSDKTINDVEITDDNKVLLLFDVSRNDFYDTISKPIQIVQYDLNLNNIATQNYGFPFVVSSDISLTADQNEFYVTGTRLKSIDLVNGKEADQVYFLKGRIDDLILPNKIPQQKTEVRIFPNPTTHDITINYYLPHTSDQLTLSIHNIAGKAVHTQPLHTHEGSVHIELDKNLPAGTYFCHLVVDGEVLGVERFVLMR